MQSSRTTTSSLRWSMVSVPGVGFSTAGPRVQTVSPAVVTGVCPGKRKKLHTHFSTFVPERCPEPLSLRMPLLLWGDDMKPERTRNDVGTPPDCAPHTNIRVLKSTGFEEWFKFSPLLARSTRLARFTNSPNLERKRYPLGLTL